MRITACVPVRRSTDALSDARMVTETGVKVVTQRHLWEYSALFFLLLEHPGVPDGMVAGPNDNFGRVRQPPGGLQGVDLGELFGLMAVECHLIMDNY